MKYSGLQGDGTTGVEEYIWISPERLQPLVHSLGGTGARFSDANASKNGLGLLIIVFFYPNLFASEMKIAIFLY